MTAFIPQKDISPEFLSDESRLDGRADSLSFPESEAELRETVGRLAAGAVPFTVQGGRTGITGGAVPEGGHILNLSRMKRITGFSYDEAAEEFSITVEPGLTLAALQDHLQRKDFGPSLTDDASQRAFERFRNAGPYFFAPDPTETTATLGGMAACNASGARSFRYGPMRAHVAALRLVLSSGEALCLTRGGAAARGRSFSLPLDRGAVVSGVLPGYAWRTVKNAAGYFVKDDMELLDLFIGQEGTLGVISSLVLRLLKRPAHTLGVLFFLPTEAAALAFALDARRLARETDRASAVAPGAIGNPAIGMTAVEYFDQGALSIVSALKNEAVRTPDPAHRAAVYVEADGGDEAGLFDYCESLALLSAKAGGDPEANWAGADARERESLRLFRHAVPEAVNAAVAERRRQTPGLTKLGTDFAVGDEALIALVGLYREKLGPAGLEVVMFGHIGNNHLHVNILPRTTAEYDLGKKLYAEIAERVVAMGGTVSGEHGVGKLKRDLLALMYGSEALEEMKRLKRAFDPGYLLNRGNLFTLP